MAGFSYRAIAPASVAAATTTGPTEVDVDQFSIMTVQVYNTAGTAAAAADVVAFVNVPYADGSANYPGVVFPAVRTGTANLTSGQSSIAYQYDVRGLTRVFVRARNANATVALTIALDVHLG